MCGWFAVSHKGRHDCPKHKAHAEGVDARARDLLGRVTKPVAYRATSKVPRHTGALLELLSGGVWVATLLACGVGEGRVWLSREVCHNSFNSVDACQKPT